VVGLQDANGFLDVGNREVSTIVPLDGGLRGVRAEVDNIVVAGRSVFFLYSSQVLQILDEGLLGLQLRILVLSYILDFFLNTRLSERVGNYQALQTVLDLETRVGLKRIDGVKNVVLGCLTVAGNVYGSQVVWLGGSFFFHYPILPWKV